MQKLDDPFFPFFIDTGIVNEKEDQIYGKILWFLAVSCR